MQPKTLLFPLLLAACEPFEDPPDQNADACGAAGYQSLVGAQIAAVTLPADLNARVIYPDTVVTLEFNPKRLNIAVNAAGRIERVYCG